jgi:hypothetical protein
MTHHRTTNTTAHNQHTFCSAAYLHHHKSFKLKLHFIAKICTPASTRTQMTIKKQALHKPPLGTTAAVNFWLLPAEEVR